jgi:glucan phosphoethanolaminetransferase (alkaline phosphatase superfamily)
MITLFILIVLTITSIRISIVSKNDYNETREVLTILISIILVIIIVVHCIYYFTSAYNYELLVEERNAIEQTLNNTKKTENNFEIGSVMGEVIKYNQRLAKYKFDNKTLLLDQYIDDRVESLEPITNQ